MAVFAAAAVVAVAVGAAWVSTLDNGDGNASAQAGTGSSSSQPAISRMPASSKTPAAGVCGHATGTVVTVRIEPDTPDPRCAAVTGGQWLRVVNGTGDYGRHARSITVAWVPGHPFTLGPGDAKTFPEHFGDYLAPGVHDLRVGPAYRAEIWLR